MDVGAEKGDFDNGMAGRNIHKQSQILSNTGLGGTLTSRFDALRNIEGDKKEIIHERRAVYSIANGNR